MVPTQMSLHQPTQPGWTECAIFLVQPILKYYFSYAFIAIDGLSSPAIIRITLSGIGNPEDFVTKHLVYPDSLAIDFDAHKLYWSDYSKPSIEFVNLDGTGRHSLAIQGEQCSRELKRAFLYAFIIIPIIKNENIEFQNVTHHKSVNKMAMYKS